MSGERVYVDSSALLKRVLNEPQTPALAVALDSYAHGGDLLSSSSLAWVEVWRTLRRVARVLPDVVVEDWAADALVGVAEVPLSADVLIAARGIGSDLLRSLDAIHLASALAVRADVVLTYDDRLADAAAGAGLEVVAPA